MLSYPICFHRSASKDVELEQTYSTLLKESSPHEKAIMRDLGRTFPHHAFFMDGKGIGQENLFNVLKAYALCVAINSGEAFDHHIDRGTLDMTLRLAIAKVWRSS